MTARTRSTRLPMPLRIGDEPWAVPAGVRIAPAPMPAPLEVEPEEPELGFVDHLVAAARELDPGAFATVHNASYVSPMERRIDERLAALAPAPAPAGRKARRSR